MSGANTSRYTVALPDAELLAVFDQMSDPFPTTRDVAADLSISPERTRVRLRGLEERHLVASRTVADRREWWITREGTRRVRTPSHSDES